MTAPLPIAVGDRFGRLVVDGPPITGGHERVYPCTCDCGKKVPVTASKLRSGNTGSCGCLARDRRLAAHTRHGQAKLGAKTPEYVIWCAMIARCTNPKNRLFADYGGRGITVCERWRDFALFFEDMGPRPAPRLTLDRIDNNRGYEPGNVRWATYRQQARNRRPRRWQRRPAQTHEGDLT